MKSVARLVLGAGALLVASTATAQAAGVCNCCNGQPEELCKAACEAVNAAGGACRPAPWYGDANAIGGEKPLNGFSYKGLDLSGASRQELEALRKWLESERRAAEVRARKTRRDRRRGRASADDYAASEAERQEAIINYQHGIQSYVAAIRGQ